MEPVLSYNFADIDALVRQDIVTTSTRFNAALTDLSRQVAPLQQLWSLEAATAYRCEQTRWQHAATALHDILTMLANAVGDGAADLAETDRRAARLWGR